MTIDKGFQISKESALHHVETLLQKDQASMNLGIQIIDAELGRCDLGLTITSEMVQGHAICHGGYLFMLADTALAFAANTYGEPCVVSRADIEFLKPAKLGDYLIAKARQLHKHKRKALYDVTIFNQKEEVVALYRGNSHQLTKT